MGLRGKIVETACVCVTGEYTGDGTTDQAIDTGVVGQVKSLKIYDKTGSVGVGIDVFETTDSMVDNNVNGLSVSPNDATGGFELTKINKIIALDNNGIFHVDDAGTDSNPNKLGLLYEYVAMVEVSV